MEADPAKAKPLYEVASPPPHSKNRLTDWKRKMSGMACFILMVPPTAFLFYSSVVAQFLVELFPELIPKWAAFILMASYHALVHIAGLAFCTIFTSINRQAFLEQFSSIFTNSELVDLEFFLKIL